MPEYLEFEVALQEIEPRIWRRFQIDATASFGDLHRAIRDGFGWHGGHLWDFTGARHQAIAGVVDEFVDGPAEGPPDAEKVSLSSHFGRSESCLYSYDFGDDWRHAVTLKSRPSIAGRFHRRLLAGDRACPPEHCGGVSGYYRYASIAEKGIDPWGEDVDAVQRQWLRGWQPAAFDLEECRAGFDSKKTLPADLF